MKPTQKMKDKSVIYLIVSSSNAYKSFILNYDKYELMNKSADLLKLSQKSNPLNDLLISLNSVFCKIS